MRARRPQQSPVVFSVRQRLLRQLERDKQLLRCTEGAIAAAEQDLLSPLDR